jgi:chemotaxis protein MotB
MDDDNGGGGIPEWVLTFGDMMSLLLTFFIMLVSMSEMKKDEEFKALAMTMQRHFGQKSLSTGMSPRTKSKGAFKSGAAVEAPMGDTDRVRIVRQGKQSAVGTVIFFPNGELELDERGREDLDAQASQFLGTPQKIEIRGHTSHEMAAQTGSALDSYDLAYERSKAVMNYLVEKHKIPVDRIRIVSAGSFEPMYQGSADKAKMNPRVEVYLLEEMAESLRGTEEERRQRRTDVESDNSSSDNKNNEKE